MIDRLSARTLIMIAVLVIVVMTSIAFLPSVFNGFVLWDDQVYVTQNETIRGLSQENITKMVTSGFLGQYCPLVILSYAVEYHFFELTPMIYHVTNLLLHIFTTVAVFWLLYLLSGSTGVSFVAAALFGIHPLHVESVAWISERKDLLCAFFYVLCLIVYTLYVRRGKGKYYCWAFVFAIFSFISKAMSVTIPGVLILIDYYLGRKWDKKAVLDKIPFFVGAFIIVGLTFYFHTLTQAFDFVFETGVKMHYIAKAPIFYLLKTCVPVNLSAIYAISPVLLEGQLAMTKYYYIALALIMVPVVLSVRSSRTVLFGSLFFVFTILPVIRIKTVSCAWAADRYMYLPSIGLFFMIAAGMNSLMKKKVMSRKIMKCGAAGLLAVVLVLFMVLTWNRCRVWKDTRTLFMDVIAKDPNIALPYGAIAKFYQGKGDLYRARMFLEAAELTDPGNKSYKRRLAVINNGISVKEREGEDLNMISEQLICNTRQESKVLDIMGEKQGNAGNYQKAIQLFRKAIKLDPDNADAYNNLGYTYFITGDKEQGEEYFNKAIQIDPGNKKTINNLNYIKKLEDNVDSQE